MPKYIDLLRSHHPPQDSSTTPGKETDEHALVDEEASCAGSNPLPPDDAANQLVEEAADDQDIEETAAAHASLDGANTSEDDKQWLDQCVDHVLTLFRAAAKHKPGKITPLSKHITSLLASLAKQPERITNLELAVSSETMKIREADADLGDLIEKSVMMMLYGIKMGLQLQFNDDELRALVLAGMLHHIGMAQISADIRHKKKMLGSKERDQIRAAPAQSMEYLQQCGIHDERILTAASQAQERFDGSGPAGLRENDISRTARIIGLLSMFEALIHYRAYRKRLLPRDAIRELLIHHKSTFDPAFLKCLIDAISLYPVGSYVQLNSGDIGQVIRVHRRLPLRPTVHLSMDRHGNGIIPRDVNMQTQPTLMVEHCMYPEDVVEISQQGQRARSA
ncbi:MAG: hypothetical protein BMS9Abin18_0910 [Zetaproteobacteria bacterium]|nr:MAG: hypothetical protein BMS9Abin18_0910 [Zetaproteobacteria bacterium]